METHHASGLCFSHPSAARAVKTQAKSLSENHFMDLEQRRISPRMDLLMSPFSKEMRLMREATTARRVDYFNLPRPLWRKLKKCLPKHTKKSTPRGGRPRASDRAVINAIWYVLCGRDANGRLCTASGLGSPPVWFTSVSRDGGAWVSL